MYNFELVENSDGTYNIIYNHVVVGVIALNEWGMPAIMQLHPTIGIPLDILDDISKERRSCRG